MKLNHCLKQKMDAAHYNIRTLAEASGVKESVVKSYVYMNTKRPAVDKLMRIADVLGCSWEDLIPEGSKYSTTSPSHSKSRYLPWNGALFAEAATMVHRIALEAGIELSHARATQITQDAYDYARINEDTHIDEKFVRYNVSK